MDESSERDRGSGHEPDDAGDKVGLGRVVEDHRPPVGSPGTDRAAEQADEVEEASEDSFPASDPPPMRSTPGS